MKTIKSKIDKHNAIVDTAYVSNVGDYVYNITDDISSIVDKNTTIISCKQPIPQGDYTPHGLTQRVTTLESYENYKRRYHDEYSFSMRKKLLISRINKNIFDIYTVNNTINGAVNNIVNDISRKAYEIYVGVCKEHAKLIGSFIPKKLLYNDLQDYSKIEKVKQKLNDFLRNEISKYSKLIN